MQLDLQPREVELLDTILTNYLSDLRYEIADTDDADLREALKRDEATLKSIIARLEQKAA